MAGREHGLPQSGEGCPCGSDRAYGTCCQPLHQGVAATTPETLMRSRYTAFALGRADYLMQTWHRSTRPAQLDLAGSPRWVRLDVLSAREEGDTGQVHFRAVHGAGNGWGFLEETSDFIREGGRWYYLAGETREGMFRPGRNDSCPCGSGRKFKACCL